MKFLEIPRIGLVTQLKPGTLVRTLPCKYSDGSHTFLQLQSATDLGKVAPRVCIDPTHPPAVPGGRGGVILPCGSHTEPPKAGWGVFFHAKKVFRRKNPIFAQFEIVPNDATRRSEIVR